MQGPCTGHTVSRGKTGCQGRGAKAAGLGEVVTLLLSCPLESRTTSLCFGSSTLSADGLTTAVHGWQGEAWLSGAEVAPCLRGTWVLDSFTGVEDAGPRRSEAVGHPPP